MRFLNRIIKSLLITSIFLFPGTGISNAATCSDYTVNSNYSYTLSDSGRYNSHWENYEVRLQYLFPQLTSDTAVTHIRFRIKFNGTDARADRNPYMDVQLADQYISYNGLFGSPASPFLMARRFKSDSSAGQWFEYSFNFDPNAGTQVANRTVYLEIGGYDSYDYCSWTFELLELRYRKYSVDFTLSITPERYVKATIGRYSGSTDTRIALQNVNDGRWITGGPNSYNSFSGTSLEYTVLDTGVKPEVTYTYYLYYKVGSSNLIPAIGPWTLTIKVPSDATIAAEQTMDAGYSAAQWAHWANDHEFLISQVRPLPAPGIRQHPNQQPPWPGRPGIVPVPPQPVPSAHLMRHRPRLPGLILFRPK